MAQFSIHTKTKRVIIIFQCRHLVTENSFNRLPLLFLNFRTEKSIKTTASPHVRSKKGEGRREVREGEEERVEVKVEGWREEAREIKGRKGKKEHYVTRTATTGERNWVQRIYFLWIL